MKKFLLFAAIAMTCAVAAPQASAQSAQFVYTGVPVSPVTPGSSFTVHLSLQVTTGGAVGDLSGLSYWFAQSSPAGSPFPFQITARNVTGSLFTDLQSGLVLPQTMDPINRNPNGTTTGTDLGALIAIGTPGQPSGTYFIADITFQVLASAQPGSFTLGNTTSATPGVGGRVSVWNDAEGDTAPIAASPFNIAIIPEPSSVALFTLGVISAGVAGYRRRLRRS